MCVMKEMCEKVVTVRRMSDGSCVGFWRECPEADFWIHSAM